MRKALVINCSSSKTRHFYNLGARKLTDWLTTQGYHVSYHDGDPWLWGEQDVDLVALSVIFSWDALTARTIALRYKGRAEIWCGGPGMFALHNWWCSETGLETVRGLDPRFDLQRGQYQRTFASRGCPTNCSFCIVPRIEGTSFTFDYEFNLAPVLCDNNLSALPVEYQEYIVKRYQQANMRLEADSGFEPFFFGPQTFERWRPVLRGAWRFAYDEALGSRGQRETEGVQRMMQILKDVPAASKRVYCLIGNEPREVCHQRAQQIIEWGGEPHCQPVLPLNWLGDPARVKMRFDWKSLQEQKDFSRYYNRRGWRSHPIWMYKPRVNEPPPFADMAPPHVIIPANLGRRKVRPSDIPPGLGNQAEQMPLFEP